MKTRAALALVVASVVACGPMPSRPIKPERLCDGAVCERWLVRDHLLLTPGIGRFFEDFGATLPESRCDSGPRSAGPVRLLWRRVLGDGTNPDDPRFSGLTRVAAAAGRTLVITPELIWQFEAATGRYLHIWRGGGLSTLQPDSVAALTRDGRYLYASNGRPVLFDLDTFDRTRAPTVVWTWREILPPETSLSLDRWKWPAPTVAPDGTLVWKSQDGHINAVTVDGRLLWRRYLPTGGWGLVGGDGTSYWAQGQPLALRLTDGATLWKARAPPGFSPDASASSLENPGASILNYWVLNWFDKDASGTFVTRQALATHSLRDGSIQAWRLWENPPLPGTSAYGPSDNAQAAQGVDGTLYIASDGYRQEGRLTGVSPVDLAPLWKAVFPAKIARGPVASRKHRGVYVATSDCKVHHFDADGRLVWMYRLDGQPLPHHQLQLVDGILYVLTQAPTGLQSDQKVCPYDDPFLREDRYGCGLGIAILCRCIDGSWPNLYLLYAFQVE